MIAFTGARVFSRTATDAMLVEAGSRAGGRDAGAATNIHAAKAEAAHMRTKTHSAAGGHPCRPGFVDLQ